MDLENGLAIDAMIAEAGSSRINTFASLDVIVSAVVLFVFILYEGSRTKMKRLWLPILGTCAVGVSLGLPLFLLLR
jgi:putative effector of murein hydrolase